MPAAGRSRCRPLVELSPDAANRYRQLFATHVTRRLARSIDRPGNFATPVTVELDATWPAVAGTHEYERTARPTMAGPGGGGGPIVRPALPLGG